MMNEERTVPQISQWTDVPKYQSHCKTCILGSNLPNKCNLKLPPTECNIVQVSTPIDIGLILAPIAILEVRDGHHSRLPAMFKEKSNRREDRGWLPGLGRGADCKSMSLIDVPSTNSKVSVFVTKSMAYKAGVATPSLRALAKVRASCNNISHPSIHQSPISQIWPASKQPTLSEHGCFHGDFTHSSLKVLDYKNNDRTCQLIISHLFSKFFFPSWFLDWILMLV